jgi:hypothetical protein
MTAVSAKTEFSFYVYFFLSVFIWGVVFSEKLKLEVNVCVPYSL